MRKEGSLQQQYGLIVWPLKNVKVYNLFTIKFFTFTVLAFTLFCLPAYAEVLNLPLYKVSSGVKAIDLHCNASEYDMQIAIPKRWLIKKAALRFDYTNSSALLKQNSQLTVSLNKTPLAQIKLDPQAPNGFAEVELPVTLLPPGYNTLSFSATQHYTQGCEQPCAPELWTRLKLDEALLTIEYEWDAVPLRLSELPELIFDPKIMNEAHLHLITENIKDEGTLTPAGIVASGAALRFDYRKTVFTLSNQVSEGMDNILVGEKSFVEGFLKDFGVNMTVEGPTLKLIHLPAKFKESELSFDPSHVLLVVTGRNADEIKLAAETMSILSIPFPDTDEMRVSEFALPEIGLYEGKQMVTAGEKYPFKKMNFKSRTFSGLDPAQEDITFRLPPDFFIKQNQQATISLDFSFGAGMKSDSSINILLNGEFVATARLDNQNGGLISNYLISLPTFLFKGGTNVLSFKPKMTPLFAEHCHFLQTANLQMSLFDTSFLEFPPMPHRIELPRLDLLFLNGFPYTRWPDGFDTLIVLSEANSAAANAALNLIGIMTQKNGYPLFGIRVSADLEEKWDKEIILVGRADTVPSEYYQKAPLQLGEMNKVPYPVYQNWDIHKGMSWSQQTSGMNSEKGIIMQFASPFKEGHAVTLFTATSDEGVERLGNALLEPTVQVAAKGDLMFVEYVVDKFKQVKFGDGADFKVTALNAGSSFVTGKGGQISSTNYYLSSYPWLYWLLLSAIMLIIAIISYIILRRRRKQRLSPNENE